MEKPGWETVCPALIETLCGERRKECRPRLVEVSQPHIETDRKWSTVSQLETTASFFFLFSLTGSSTTDRKSHVGSHLHLNKDRQWLCQSPLSKLPYLMNVSTISSFFSPIHRNQPKAKMDFVYFAKQREKKTPLKCHFDANYDLCNVWCTRGLIRCTIKENHSVAARPLLINIKKLWLLCTDDNKILCVIIYWSFGFTAGQVESYFYSMCFEWWFSFQQDTECFPFLCPIKMLDCRCDALARTGAGLCYLSKLSQLRVNSCCQTVYLFCSAVSKMPHFADVQLSLCLQLTILARLNSINHRFLHLNIKMIQQNTPYSILSPS